MLVSETAQNRIDTIVKDEKVFRIEIQGGGCTGFKYHFDITDKNDDDIFISENIVVDPMSILYLQGSTLDFKDDIFSQSFVIDNPNVKTTCGCGESIGF